MKTRSLERTKTPGVFKRGGRYVVVYRDPQGRQRKHSARTLAEARNLKATLTADIRRGDNRTLSRVTFAEYAPEWIASYQGRTTRGFRDETRADYARDLGLDPETREPLDPPRGAIAFFGRLRLAEIEPRDVKLYAAHHAERGLSPASWSRSRSATRVHRRLPQAPRSVSVQPAISMVSETRMKATRLIAANIGSACPR